MAKDKKLVEAITSMDEDFEMCIRDRYFLRFGLENRMHGSG